MIALGISARSIATPRPPMQIPTMTKTRHIPFVASLGSLFGLLTVAVVMNRALPPQSADAPRSASHVAPAVAASASRIDAAAFLAPHFDRASQRTAEALEARTEEVRSFFLKAQRQTGGFAKTALGWSSKWAMLVDAVPFNGSGRHETFLRAEFERQVFSPDELAKAIEHAVIGFVGDLASIENRMLVDIRADLMVSEIDSTRLDIEGQQVGEAFRKIVATSAESAAWDAAGDVSTLVAAIVIERAVARALFGAARGTGTSAAVLGTGAATSCVSFGISMAVALVVDQILSRIWDWAMDPEGNLRASLNDHLRELGDAICDGNRDSEGLRSQLQQLATERASERRLAAHQLVNVSLR